jgi:uncharacterized membrane protein
MRLKEIALWTLVMQTFISQTIKSLAKEMQTLRKGQILIHRRTMMKFLGG